MYVLNEHLDELFLMFKDKIWEDRISGNFDYASRASRLMVAFTDWAQCLSDEKLGEYLETDKDFVIKEARKRIDDAFDNYFNGEENGYKYKLNTQTR